MKRATGIMLAVMILATGSARAEEQGFELTPTPKTTSINPKPKSPGTATALAFAGLVVPIAIAAMMASGGSTSESSAVGFAVVAMAGSIFGPGIGHAYAGETGRFWRGAGLRTLGWGGLAGGALLAWDNRSSEGPGGLLALGGLSLYVGSTIYDLVTSGDSAKRHNAKLAFHKVSVEPVWVPRE